ncbi:PEP-CTERM sorting domain-containing protein [Stieleria sp. TO1_6]|uniref:PEP-CTERM sorting domain-containing protein n=1 Tax=Stieleria tagensis TaxID=2956795 RepID=UPI00209A87C7|nr:PEP-CTERM sorting domain-containing protein [Stieleria tagensis]MCO8124684.1 PEP-CTERM sorting domain-containing protein [Stieleria tagensis]
MPRFIASLCSLAVIAIVAAPIDAGVIVSANGQPNSDPPSLVLGSNFLGTIGAPVPQPIFDAQFDPAAELAPGFASALASVSNDFKFVLQGVNAFGAAQPTGGLGNGIIQGTMGGTFSVFGGNTLLLSGSLGFGVLQGTSTSPTGLFLGEALFYDGLLLPFLETSSGYFESSLFNIETPTPNGPLSSFEIAENGMLADFTAAHSFAILAVPAANVPEPTTMVSFSLLMMCGGMGFRRRRR